MSVIKVGEAYYYLNGNKLMIKVNNEIYYNEFHKQYYGDDIFKISGKELLKIIELKIRTGDIKCQYNNYLENIEIKMGDMLITIEKISNYICSLYPSINRQHILNIFDKSNEIYEIINEMKNTISILKN